MPELAPGRRPLGRVLVTGGSGYIGTRFMQALAREPEVEEIVDLDIRPPARPIDKVRHVERSVTQDLRDIFTDRGRPVDTACHLAWTVNPLRDPVKQREICIGGTDRFLEGCAAGDVRHVLYMSSATAYGANETRARPVGEDDPLMDHHHFQYSAEKKEGEELCRRFAAWRPGTLLQVVRPSVVGGPNVDNFIFRAMDRAVNFLPIGMDPEVQLVHEDDVAGALVAVLRSRVPGPVNVSGDGTMTMSEAYRRIGARAIKLPLAVLMATVYAAWRLDLTKVTEAPPGFLYFVAYPWLVSNRKLKEVVGYKPRYTTEEVLESFLLARRARPAKTAPTPAPARGGNAAPGHAHGAPAGAAVKA